MLYIGIDLGTSSLKLLLTNEKGDILNTVSSDYPLSFPQSGWSEQDPEHWWSAVKTNMPRLMHGYDKSQIAGIGCGGQMHGLVILDEEDRVIRPVILWNDTRTAKQVDYLNNTVGKDTISRLTGNIAFAGFTAPKILWLKENEPENFSRISKIMLPKDYINYKLTGIHSCDYSDASGTLLLDVQHKCWSKEMLDICGIPESVMPTLYESWQSIGSLSSSSAEDLGLPDTVRVAAGAGDNAASAVGTGTIGSGKCNISLGTSGTIFISDDDFRVDSFNSLHAFAHADGGFHLMGCMLSAASCNKWFCESILKSDDYAGEQAEITDDMLGRNSVFFLPYLMGERSPINDTNARGTFIGMTMDTSRSDLVLSILEGVAFAIRDSFEVAKSLGIEISRSFVCGGGAKSPLWQKIIANVLSIPLDTVATEQGAGYGGAMLAMVACGEYSSVADCADKLVCVQSTVYPEKELSERYEHKYQNFKKIYPSCKKLFADLNSQD